MISRSDLSKFLLYLVPDAKFSFWPDDGVRDNVEMGNEDPLIKIPGWVIDWKRGNKSACPTLDEIIQLDKNLVEQKIADENKKVRNASKAEDLSLIASYNIEKKTNPDLLFSDYLDDLEVKSKDQKDSL